MWPACPGVACPWKDIKIILMTRTMMALMVILTLIRILMTTTMIILMVILTLILITRKMIILMVILTLMWILMNKPPGNEQHSNSRPVLPMLEVRSVKPW